MADWRGGGSPSPNGKTAAMSFSVRNQIQQNEFVTKIKSQAEIKAHTHTHTFLYRRHDIP